MNDSNSPKVYPYIGKDGLSAFEILGLPVYVYSFITQRVCWANPRALPFWSAGSLEELTGRILTPYSASTSARLDDYRRAFRRGEERVETWTLYPKGTPSPILCRCSGISLSGHEEAMLVEVKGLSEAALPAFELRTIEALRHIPLMISLLSAKGDVLMRNPAATAHFRDFDAALTGGEDAFAAMFASAEDARRLLEQAGQEVVGRLDATMTLPGGPVHTVHLALVSDPVTGENARLVAQEDITPLIQANRQLAASQEALDAVLNINAVPAIVVSVQRDDVLNANVAATKLLGPGMRVGADVREIFADPADFAALRGDVLANRGGSRQCQLRVESGEGRWAALTSARIIYEREDAFVIMMSDIDALYRSASELKDALSVERRLAEVQRRYLAIASHEFRTPLALIDSAAQRLMRTDPADPLAQVHQKAGRVRATVNRMLELLDRLSERAHDTEGALGYTPSAIELGPLVEKVAASFAEHNPDFRIEVCLPHLPRLMIDTTLMEQAFNNLLSNAEKYSSGAPRVEITGRVRPHDVQIDVRDWGIGTVEHERSRIFSGYVRGSNVGDRPGTGLGLSIVSQIIGLHGGLVELVGENRPGSTFRLTLPR